MREPTAVAYKRFLNVSTSQNKCVIPELSCYSKTKNFHVIENVACFQIQPGWSFCLVPI